MLNEEEAGRQKDREMMEQKPGILVEEERYRCSGKCDYKGEEYKE